MPLPVVLLSPHFKFRFIELLPKTHVIASQFANWRGNLHQIPGNLRGSPHQCEHWFAMTRV